MTRPGSAALLGVGHLAVAWNEEMVFRGYGFETVRDSAWARRKRWRCSFQGLRSITAWIRSKCSGMLAGGTTLMLLRLHTDALWMPVGYHWAWSVSPVY